MAEERLAGASYIAVAYLACQKMPRMWYHEMLDRGVNAMYWSRPCYYRA